MRLWLIYPPPSFHLLRLPTSSCRHPWFTSLPTVVCVQWFWMLNIKSTQLDGRDEVLVQIWIIRCITSRKWLGKNEWYKFNFDAYLSLPTDTLHNCNEEDFFSEDEVATESHSQWVDWRMSFCCCCSIWHKLALSLSSWNALIVSTLNPPANWGNLLKNTRTQ